MTADSESVKDGDIALLLLDGNRAVRRLKHIDGGVWLIPSNNAFADEFIATEEMEEFAYWEKLWNAAENTRILPP